MKRYFLIFCVLSVVAGSCARLSALLHDGDVVARVGKHLLYADDVKEVIPLGMTGDDSLAAVRQYVDRWASEMVLIDIANLELTKEEKDLAKEIEDYRNSILRYRYEQKYVNQRLDTVIAPSLVEQYYKEHPSSFVLDMTIVKARYALIPENAGNLRALREDLRSRPDGEEVVSDSLLRVSSVQYADYSGSWVPLSVLASEFAMGETEFLYSLRSWYIERSDGHGNLRMACVYDIAEKGHGGPVDYYERAIKDVLLSARKKALVTNLERDLLESARQSGKIEIYSKKK